MPGNCRFNDAWLTGEFSGWIRKNPKDAASAYCLYCKKTFSVIHMGYGAVKSHAKGTNCL